MINLNKLKLDVVLQFQNEIKQNKKTNKNKSALGYFLVQLLDINFGLYLHSSSYPQNRNNKNSREKKKYF
jgi:hypothetical protein